MGKIGTFLLFSVSQLIMLFSSYSFQLVIAIPKWFKPAPSKWRSSRRTIVSCTISSSSALRISSRECPTTHFLFATSWIAEVKRTIWLCDWHALIRSRRTSSHSTSKYKVPKSYFVVKVILSPGRLRSFANLIYVKSSDWGNETSTIGAIYGELTRREDWVQSLRGQSPTSNKTSTRVAFLCLFIFLLASAIRRDNLISCWWVSAINSRTRQADCQLKGAISQWYRWSAFYKGFRIDCEILKNLLCL